VKHVFLIIASHGYIEREKERERERDRNAMGGPKTGVDNSVIPEDQDETWCVRVRPEIRKCCLANSWIVES